jgi:hypothetical protein
MSTVQGKPRGPVHPSVEEKDATANLGVRTLGAQTRQESPEQAAGRPDVLRRSTGTVVEMVSSAAPSGAIGRWLQYRFSSPAERRARLTAELGLIE